MGGEVETRREAKKKKDGLILRKQKSTPEGLIVSLELLKGEAEGKEKLSGESEGDTTKVLNTEADLCSPSWERSSPKTANFYYLSRGHSSLAYYRMSDYQENVSISTSRGPKTMKIGHSTVVF